MKPLALLVLSVAVLACGGGSDSTDAPPVDTAPAADGAAPDAPVPVADATPADAAAPVVLYGLIAGRLVRIDPATADLTDLGAGPADARFVWDPSVSLMYVVQNPLTNPNLAVIDLCTGELGPGPAITRDGTQVNIVEGFARHPDTGAWYACYDTTGDAASAPVSETFGTFALDSGAVTSVGTVDTFTDDCDSLLFIDSTLELLDVDATDNRAGLYSVNLATGATTIVTNLDDDVVRVAWDASRSTLFGYARTNRQLVTIERGTGALTIVGETHAAATYGTTPMTALAAAPQASCP